MAVLESGESNAPDSSVHSDASSSVGAPSPKRRHWAIRVVAICAVAITAWHIFASFLWISPPSELRTLVPGNALSSYMLPWYGQSWSVFAPEPINGDYRFQVRAVISDGTDVNGQPIEKTTEWVDATAVELSMSRYNLFPPRAASLSTQQATKMLNVWKLLTPEQKKITALGYYRGNDWLGRMQGALNDKGTEQTKGTVVDYIVQERYTSAYATQVAYAVWGKDNVKQVQFEVSRQNIIPFEQRHDPTAQRPARETATTGWRGTLVMPGQSDDAFRNVFRREYMKEMGN